MGLIGTLSLSYFSAEMFRIASYVYNNFPNGLCDCHCLLYLACDAALYIYFLSQVSGLTGCSMLLYHLLSQTLLPAHWCAIDIGGFGAEALFIDTDQCFSVLQLAAIMEATIKKKIVSAHKQSCIESSKKHHQPCKQNFASNTDPLNSILKNKDLTSKNITLTDCTETKNDARELDSSSFKNFQSLSKEESELRIKTLISDCLKNLVYLKCQFSVQFFTTILTIDQILTAHPLVVLIFIDSLPSYYWSDRIYSTDSWQGISKQYNVVMRSFLTQLRKNGVALIYVNTESLPNNYIFQKSSNDKPVVHTCVYCGEKSNVSNFLCTHCSPSIKIAISIPRLLGENDISDDCRRRRTYEVQVITNNGTSTLQATIHQYGIKWHT